MHYLNKPAPQTLLVHHGIKGQKWGIRRFQNEDGTLTKAGIERSELIRINPADLEWSADFFMP